jgi:hypothetical protein
MSEVVVLVSARMGAYGKAVGRGESQKRRETEQVSGLDCDGPGAERAYKLSVVGSNANELVQHLRGVGKCLKSA